MKVRVFLTIAFVSGLVALYSFGKAIYQVIEFGINDLGVYWSLFIVVGGAILGLVLVGLSRLIRSQEKQKDPAP